MIRKQDKRLSSMLNKRVEVWHTVKSTVKDRLGQYPQEPSEQHLTENFKPFMVKVRIHDIENVVTNTIIHEPHVWRNILAVSHDYFIAACSSD